MTTVVETITINKLNTLTDFMPSTPADRTGESGAATFEAKIEAADGKWFIEIDNTDGSADAAVTIKSGAYVGAANVNAGTVGAGRRSILFADSSLCKNSDGRIRLEITPATEIKVRAAQLLPAKCN